MLLPSVCRPNTFMAARGKVVGNYLGELDLADTEGHILDTAAEYECDIILQFYAVVSS